MDDSNSVLTVQYEVRSVLFWLINVAQEQLSENSMLSCWSSNEVRVSWVARE